MKRVNSILNSQWRLIFLLLPFFAGCQDLSDSGRGQLLSGDEQEITLNLNVPGKIQTDLRSITSDDEKAISEVDVLAFDVHPADSIIFSYLVTKAAMTTDESGNQVLKIVAQIKPGVQQQFVVITNAHQEVTNLVATGITGRKKANVFAQLQVSLGATPTKWNAVSSVNFQAFPMWGESAPVEIIKTNKPTINIDLLRMVARIDVKLDTTVAGLTSMFKIGAVYLYNSNTAGLIVPTSANVTINGSGKPAVTQASIPAGLNSPRGSVTAIEYLATTPGDSVAIQGAIYTFETAASAAPDSATCVVIGGYYNGNYSKMTYYRVNFYDTDGTTLLDILRNRQYNLTIKRINSAGYDTPQEAFDAKAINGITTIVEWEDGDWDIVTNGQYYLTINKNVFKYSKGAQSDSVEVKTDYIAADNLQWKIVSITDLATSTAANWITITKKDSTVGFNFAVSAYVSATPLEIRSAEIIVQAGVLMRKISIQQCNVVDASVTFNDPDISAAYGDTLTMYVSSTGYIVDPKPRLAVVWDPQIAGSKISIWQSPCEKLDYIPNLYLGPILGIHTYTLPFTAPTATIDHSMFSSSDTDFPKGVKLVGRVSNDFLTVEKELVIKVVRQ
ncbi:hypothetical protein AGMMS49525_05540 [Bacteroidia bacterium]|nr:hypothetical protein AGMMS49525_05540 [Bacteroidia bacterium]